MADDAAELALFRLNALQLRGDWSAHEDGDGRLFYFDHAARRAQWDAPPAFAGREGALMMALMLQHAVARSGFWSAHDAGHGTLYYFNERTRASVWERPAEWGSPEAEAQARDADAAGADEGEGDVLARARAAIAAEQAEEAKAAKTKKAKKAPSTRSREAEEEPQEEEEEKEEPMTEDERAAAERKQAAERRRVEAFRQMLRDKTVMPFTKWSVAMPRILSDPRFVAIPTMEERRAIFDHFVQHRRDDLKAEKKSKLKDAKKAFSTLLRDQLARQLRDGTWDAKTDLAVFLATLEDALGDAQFTSLRENAMALLPTSTQEKLYEKAVADSKEQAEKLAAEDAKLFAFLQEQLTTSAAVLRDARWENEQLQQLVASFYQDASTPLLSAELQWRVFRRVQDAAAPARRHPDAKYGAGHQAPSGAVATAEAKLANPISSSKSTRHDTRERSRPRSRDRDRRSRSQSRGRAREREPREERRSTSRRGHRSARRSPSSSSSSSSRSRSRSRSRRRGASRHRSRRSRSSSRSSSRSRSRRR